MVLVKCVLNLLGQNSLGITRLQIKNSKKFRLIAITFLIHKGKLSGVKKTQMASFHMVPIVQKLHNLFPFFPTAYMA